MTSKMFKTFWNNDVTCWPFDVNITTTQTCSSWMNFCVRDFRNISAILILCKQIQLFSKWCIVIDKQWHSLDYIFGEFSPFLNEWNLTSMSSRTVASVPIDFTNVSNEFIRFWEVTKPQISLYFQHTTKDSFPRHLRNPSILISLWRWRRHTDLLGAIANHMCYKCCTRIATHPIARKQALVLSSARYGQRRHRHQILFRRSGWLDWTS